MILSRELGKRIWGGSSTNIENGGSGISSDYIAGLLTGYAKESWVDEHYISIDFFSRLFQAHGTENGSEIDVLPNDMDTTITSVESMFGFWTNLYISALGSNGAAPAGISLGMLTDVAISGTPSAGQVLTFDAVSGKWINSNATGASSLATLTDVTLTSLQTNQILIYDANTQKWVNSSVKTINGYSIFGTGDIPASGGGGGNYLPLAGGTMTGTINATLPSNAFANASSNSYTDTRHCSIIYGVSNTANNTGYTAFHYKGNGSTDNYITFGFWGNDELFNIKANGNVGIATATPQNRLTVVGGVGYLIGLYSNDPYDSYIQCYLGSTMKAEVGYSHNMAFLSCQPAGKRIGVNDNGVPVFRTAWNGSEHVLLHSNLNYFYDSIFFITSGNYYSRVNPILIGNYQSTYDCSYIAHHCVEIGSSSNYVTFGLYGADELLNITGYGSVGIGTTSPSYKLHVVGTIYASGAITALSDARKKDITGEVGVTVEQIAHAPAVQFLWKDKERRKDGQQVGTLAQYWQTVLPEVVSDKGGELSMQYGVAALVSAIVTARKVVDHERRIRELEKENERLKEEIEQLRLN